MFLKPQTVQLGNVLYVSFTNWNKDDESKQKREKGKKEITNKGSDSKKLINY